MLLSFAGVNSFFPNSRIHLLMILAKEYSFRLLQWIEDHRFPPMSAWTSLFQLMILRIAITSTCLTWHLVMLPLSSVIIVQLTLKACYLLQVAMSGRKGTKPSAKKALQLDHIWSWTEQHTISKRHKYFSVNYSWQSQVDTFKHHK